MNFYVLRNIINEIKKVDVYKPNPTLIKIDKYLISKSLHQKETRGNEITARDFGIDDNEFRRIFSLFVYNHKPSKGIYHLLYKPNGNKELKYNDIIVEVLNNEIKIITILQHQILPYEYNSYKNDKKTILENNHILIFI